MEYTGAEDGSVNLAVQNEEQWRRLCRIALARPDLATDPRYDSNEKRVAARHELEALIEEIFRKFRLMNWKRSWKKLTYPLGG